MHAKTLASALFFAVLSAKAQAGPVLASSTFDTDAQGWTAAAVDAGSWSVAGPATAAFNGEGNPGGSLRVADPDSWWTYFVAPAAFLGDKSAAFGGSLSFDSRYVTPGDSNANEADVVLKGAGLTLLRDLTGTLPVTWTHFDVSLNASGAWRVGNTFSGAIATDAQILAVLTGLDALWINAEHFTPVKEVIALDNVVLAAPVPEPETYAMMLAGLGVLGAAARRRKAA